MAQITFQPHGVTATCEPGDTVFNVARRSGVRISTACAGKGNCGLCRVKILAGEAHISALNAVEKKHLGNVYFLTKQRLSCQTTVADAAAEIAVEVPPV